MRIDLVGVDLVRIDLVVLPMCTGPMILLYSSLFRRRKVRERERRIQSLFHRFNGGTISIESTTKRLNDVCLYSYKPRPPLIYLVHGCGLTVTLNILFKVIIFD